MLSLSAVFAYDWEFLAVPRIKSAIKRVDVAERNRERNRSWKAAVRTARNKVEESLKKADKNTLAGSISEAFSVIDCAVAKGILHKNTAARRKARMIKAVRESAG